jgi:hypothetical protein
MTPRALNGVWAATLALGFCALDANAQPKHAQTINHCTVIDKPGAYLVDKVIQATARDLTPTPTAGFAACILITTDFVTLDLGGYTITGPRTPGSLGVAAQSSDQAVSGVKVHSGTVTNFATGVLLTGTDHTVEHINASQNAVDGIVVGFGFGASLRGDGHRVIGNTANRNQSSGMSVHCPSVVLGNMATGNGLGGDIVADLLTCTLSHNSPKAGDDIPAP